MSDSDPITGPSAALEGPTNQPPEGIDVEGLIFVRRGCDETGWSRAADLRCRCARCGSIVHARLDDYFECTCGAMYLDVDAGRLGSTLGDEAILTYRIG